MSNLLQLLPEHVFMKTGLKLEVNDLVNVEKSSLLVQSRDMVDFVFRHMRHLRIFNGDVRTFRKVINRCGQSMKSVVVYTEAPFSKLFSFDDSHIRQLAKQCPNLEELPSSGSRSNSFRYLRELNSTSKLKKLSILPDGHQLTTEQFWQFIDLCPNLERLQLTSYAFEKFLTRSDTIDKVPSIKSISIIDHIEFCGQDLMTVIQTFKYVFLEIVHFRVNLDEFNQLLECPQIESLKVSDGIFAYTPMVDILECPQASKIVSIDIRRNHFDVTHRDGYKLTSSIEKLRLFKSKFCSDSMIKLLTNYVVFSELKKIDLIIRYDSNILESFILLVKTRGPIINWLEMIPEENAIIYIYEDLINTIREHCLNIKVLKLYLLVNKSLDIVFDEQFYRKLYSVRVRQLSYFKIKFDYEAADKYWTSIEVLDRIEKQANKTFTLEMGSNVYHSWNSRPTNM